MSENFDEFMIESKFGDFESWKEFGLYVEEKYLEREQELAALKAEKEQDSAVFIRHAQEYQAEIKALKEQLRDYEWVLNEISTYADCDDVNGEAGNIARQFLAKIKKEE